MKKKKHLLNKNLKNYVRIQKLNLDVLKYSNIRV